MTVASFVPAAGHGGAAATWGIHMNRRRSVLAGLVVGVIAAGGLMASPGAAHAEEPAPPPARDFGAVSYLGRPAVDKAGNVKVPQPSRRSATAADADTFAARTKQKSYLDPTTMAAASAPRTPPAAPGADADECLGATGANSATGRVHNRFLWCQRWQLHAVRGTAGPGVPGGIKLAEMTMNYDAVAYGRDDGRRGVTIFFRSTGLNVHPRKGYIRENAMLYQKIDCTGDAAAERPSTGEGCDTSDSYIGKQLDEWDDGWTSWTLSSDASASRAEFGVLYHQWQLHGYVVDSFQYRLADSLAEKHTIRCDSAGSQGFSKRRSAACINDDVIPHLQYSRADSKVAEVAEHIACAQEAPFCSTYPLKDNAKLIPGKFVDGRRLDTTALHRVRSAPTNSPIAEANRRVVRAECAKLPASVYDTSKGQECDEYPFASTKEGAACCEPPAFDWDFSIKGVDKTVNGCAGNALKKYYRDDRILYHHDGFFVRITDAPPAGPEFCDSIPADEDEPDTGGGGGGDPVEDLAPSVNAGPDVRGEEGAPVALTGSASDPETGTPDLRWSFRPVSGVDPGASCSFSATASAGTTVTCTDDGVFEVTLTGWDGVNPGVSDSALVTLTNVSPGFGVSPLATRATAAAAAAADDPPENPGILTPAPWQVFRKGDEVKLAVAYTEPAENDTHTCTTAWDDGTTSTSTGADLICRTTHTFDRAGMFTIRTTVTDDDGGSGSADVMVVVYDPDGGWGTVDGSYDSPAGALPGSPAAVGAGWLHLTGRYYPQNKNTPHGAARNWLPVDPYRFDITGTLEWLVVTPDGKIAAKATGTLAGSSERYGIVSYGYESCTGATRPGACQDGPDRVRTVVWPLSKGSYPTGDVFYDSRASAGYDVDVADPLPMRTGATLIQWP